MRRLAIVVSLITVCMLAITSTHAQNTTVYIVRHAEKNLSDPKAKDPALSPEGVQRSYDLDTILAGQPIAAVFSTNYTRTRKTGEPLAKRIGKDINLYDPAKPADLVATVKKDHSGKTVLIIGHSNTILELITAFGGSATMTEIKDNDYKYLFKLELDENGVTTAELEYGQGAQP